VTIGGGPARPMRQALPQQTKRRGMADPLVSVAVVTYNQKPFLSECIDSVLAQDYRRVQIVVADDASTDGTREMLRTYQLRHPSIFTLVLADENGGITVNSNRAHAACEGEYIAWMGGDDLMLPEKLSAQVEHMERHPQCSIVYHDLDVFQSETSQTLFRYSQRDRPRSGGVRQLLRHGAFNGACSTMVRRKNAPAHGFDPRLLVASDLMYWIETLLPGGEIHYIPRVLGRHRRHAGNVTNPVTSPRILQAYEDHFTTAAILLARHPEYSADLLHFLSATARGLRRVRPDRYRRYVISSFLIRPNVRSLIATAAHSLTFGRFRA
jgi:glycosyltransferase involved in cell wall biosynthesis